MSPRPTSRRRSRPSCYQSAGDSARDPVEVMEHCDASFAALDAPKLDPLAAQPPKGPVQGACWLFEDQQAPKSSCSQTMDMLSMLKSLFRFTSCNCLPQNIHCSTICRICSDQRESCFIEHWRPVMPKSFQLAAGLPASASSSDKLQ